MSEASNLDRAQSGLERSSLDPSVEAVAEEPIDHLGNQLRYEVADDEDGEE